MSDQNSNENIGKRIAMLRKKQQLTQAQLADKIGSTSKHISEIERGVTGMSIDTQVQLSNHLNCSIDYLIKGEDYKTVDPLLPRHISAILHSDNPHEIDLLLEYLSLFEKLRDIDS